MVADQIDDAPKEPPLESRHLPRRPGRQPRTHKRFLHNLLRHITILQHCRSKLKRAGADALDVRIDPRIAGHRTRSSVNDCSLLNEQPPLRVYSRQEAWRLD